jgi:Domain of unknown function (DUF5664)
LAESKGLKYDADKLRMDLIPQDSLRDLAAVYTMGARKYADENWRQGIEWKRVYGAMLRHLSLWILGHDIDDESSLNHLAHVAWGAFTLLNYSRTHRELDNRPRGGLDSNKNASAGQPEPPAVSGILRNPNGLVPHS